jgi:threonine dehydratase
VTSVTAISHYGGKIALHNSSVPETVSYIEKLTEKHKYYSTNMSDVEIQITVNLASPMSSS